MSNLLIAEKAKNHYNMVSDPWRFIFGDDFHMGYFENKNDTLEKATKQIIDKLSELALIDRKSKLLDVGCGLGEPAFYLHKKIGCKITGITISDRGYEIAKATSEQYKLTDKVNFKVADILHNDFEKDSFDIVWIMEVSHLIRDKMRLFTECKKVLNKGGVLLMCGLKY
jgi:27-O-demethylrifamycin SV methyltransferase